MPSVSVIMSTYREPEHYLRRALDSILTQTLTDFELIVVADDPHNTAALHQLAEYARRDSRVVLLINQKNRGLVASLNRALSVATGEYVARMDADDIAMPTRLERQRRYLCDNDLDITGAWVRRIDEQGVPLGDLPHRTDTPSVVMASLRIAPCVPHPTWFVRRDVYTALHGYRDIPRCEDYDLLLRALRHGFRIGICPEPLLQYRMVQHGISRSALLQQHVTSRYLAEHFSRLEHITREDIRRLTATISPSQNARYRRAEQLFYKAAARHGWQRAWYLLASVAASPHQWRRFYDMWRLRRTRQGGTPDGLGLRHHADI